MRYSQAHKEDTRCHLVEASRAVAKRSGFAASGVDALAKASGLSGGAVYRHYSSKAELFAAIIDRELEHSMTMLGGDPEESPEGFARTLRGYLSSYHALHPEDGCAIPALGAEISRAGPEVKRKVETVLKRLQQTWAKGLHDDDEAWAVLSQCVGAILLARSVESEQARKEILGASRRFLGHTIRTGDGQ